MKILFNEKIFSQCETRFDIKKRDIISIINRPKSSQDEIIDKNVFRYYLSPLIGSQYFLIITSIEKGSIVVHSAFRLLSNFINKYNENDPKYVLMQFVLNFGLQFRVIDVYEKYVSDKKYRFLNEKVFNIEVINPKKHSWMSNFVMKASNSFVHVALGFCIDLSEYISWLNNYEDDNISIEISHSIRGLVSKRDLINSSFFMHFRSLLRKFLLSDKGDFITVKSPNYDFSVGLSDKNELYINKNEYCLSYSLNELNLNNSVYVYILNTPRKIGLTVLDDDDLHEIVDNKIFFDIFNKKEKKLLTPPIYPSNHLIAWAQNNDLLKVVKYSNESHLFETVVDSVFSVQSKVDNIGGIHPFWNRTKAEIMIPKKENDNLSTIHMLLSDIANLKSLQISPEHKTGGGSLDFLITGILESNKYAKVCIEFKNAHSTRLFHGLKKQLPRYMESKGTNLGIFCVLFFKGQFFDRPKKYDKDSLLLELEKVKILEGLHNIRVIILDLSTLIPPSLI
jgi:hypothetical protein